MRLTLAFLFAAVFALAQDPRGFIRGTLSDTSGAVIPGARVRATANDTGVVAVAQANESGLCSLPYLIPGLYKVSVEQTGFKSYVQPNVEVRVAETTELPIQLEVGQVTETVEIKDSAPPLETESASLVPVFARVNSVGEYLVGRLVAEQAGSLDPSARKAFIGEFYSSYYSWVNLVGFLLQTFVVSRLFHWIGVGRAIFVLLLIAAGGYAMLALMPVLSVVRAAKILENSTDYSLNNTVRHALFLPTSREAKYKAKAAIGTFFARAGDLLQTGIADAGTRFLALGVSGFAALNLGWWRCGWRSAY